MKKVPFIVALSLFALTACATTTDTSNVDSLGNSDSLGSLYTSGLDCEMLSTDEARQNCEIQVNDTIGALLENDVLSHFDLDRCIALKDQIGSNCQGQIESTGVKGPVPDEELALFREAVNGSSLPTGDDSPSPEVDSANCDSLTTPGYAEYCRAEIAGRMELSLFDEITLSGNSARCGELTTLQEECEDFFFVRSDIPSPDGA
ncbi:MAG: hypothetical protein R3B71_06040 [Candidatus Gracilibacteria bacterium]|nr:hypothetical protein [Candidatus Peregrinibacteria bacterium]